MVFTQYSVGESVLMDNSAFVELLRDAKVLSKLDLTTHYAHMIFKENATEKRINFAHFREVVVPLVARKKKLSVEDLLAKFCRIEGRKAADARVEKKEEEANSARKLVSASLMIC